MAKTGIEEHRKRREAYDAKERDKLRGPTMLILKPRLDAITASMAPFESKAYRANALLKFIYTTEPPRRENCPPLPDKLDLEDKKAMKAVIRNSVFAYATDKNMGFGIEWYILCEETVKILNNLYGFYKGEE